MGAELARNDSLWGNNPYYPNAPHPPSWYSMLCHNLSAGCCIAFSSSRLLPMTLLIEMCLTGVSAPIWIKFAARN